MTPSKLFRRLVCLSVCLVSLSSAAQSLDLTVSIGAYVPLYKGVQSDLLLKVQHEKYYANGLGYLAGLQWCPSIANVDNAFGIPLGIAYKLPHLEARRPLSAGTQAAWSTAGHSGYTDAKTLLGSFLLNLFNDMEFYAGITPGFITGGSSDMSTYYSGKNSGTKWTEKKLPLTMTLDAGLSFNYEFWRLGLKLSPSLHYNVFNSLVFHHDYVSKGDMRSEITPVRMFCSVSAALLFYL